MFHDDPDLHCTSNTIRAGHAQDRYFWKVDEYAKRTLLINELKNVFLLLIFDYNNFFINTSKNFEILPGRYKNSTI